MPAIYKSKILKSLLELKTPTGCNLYINSGPGGQAFQCDCGNLALAYAVHEFGDIPLHLDWLNCWAHF